MAINRFRFYAAYRGTYGGLSQTQVNGYEAIFDFWDSRSVLKDTRWLAYILATAFHETGRRIEPVREGFCPTDACSIRAVTRLFNNGRIRRNYALPHANGKSYFGRGLVQLTWGSNYKKAGVMIGLGNQLYENPSLLLRLDVSVKVMCVGMLIGSFSSGHNLERYFTNRVSDWKGARRIVNGTDKDELIAKYARNFHGFLSAASTESIDMGNEAMVETLATDLSTPEDQAILELPFAELQARAQAELPTPTIYDAADVELVPLEGPSLSEFLVDAADVRVLSYEEFLTQTDE